MKPIELSSMDRALLTNLTVHDGWRVLEKLLNAQCQQANEEVIKCDPLEKDKILTLQLTARAMNIFCAALLKQVLWNKQVAEAEEQERIAAC